MDEANDDKENINPDPKVIKPSKSYKPRNATKRRKQKGKAICEPPSKSHLDCLPPEILGMICEELWDEDIPALRLQCRYLCEIVTYYFLWDVLVRFNRTSVDSLRELSEHPFLNQNVKTITYEPNLLDVLSRQEWEKNVPCRHSTSDIPPPPKESASQREIRSFNRTVKKSTKSCTPKELDTAWPIYQRYIEEQDSLIKRDNACQDLSRAFKRFPNLKAVHVNCGFEYIGMNPYGDGLCQPSNNPPWLGGEAPGVEQIVSLIKMLDSVDVKLNRLRIEDLNWRFFLQYEEDYIGSSDLFYSLGRIVQSLRDIKLVLTTWSGLQTDAEDDRGEYLEIDQCRRYLDRGSLGRILSAAPDLEKFTVEFDAFNSRTQSPIDFHYLVLDTHWSKLDTIKLDSIDTHESDWIKFFERHAASLKHVSLSQIRLLDGKWPDVLERMQRLCKFEEAHFDLDLCGVVPVQRWNFNNSDETSSVDDSVQANRNRWALEKFMVEGGVCPLRDEVAHPQS
ncbi:MAG: hypothetical protein Q9226_005859 [Calogaya cf. arnoldii]